MERRTIESGTEWEAAAGYSRAVRVGPHVSISGTTATDSEGEVVAGDAYEQTTRAIANVEGALAEAGAELADVVRTRIYVTDIGEWEAIGKAHAEAFGEIRPATTMVEVSQLIAPELCVEIEADAIVDGATEDADNTDGGRDHDEGSRGSVGEGTGDTDDTD
jgi:enamine deaminase RidA (YjgF/YER057c/UK114 family)